MHLFELCESTPQRSGPSVPEWVLGCFRRRSITFFTGTEDVATEVIWLQSRGLTADYRRTPPGVGVTSLAALRDLALSELLALARVEGGFAHTRWDGELMHWSDWTAFQTHAKWPEPGRLTRVGGCMVELAPSGAYVEDWRHQPSLRGGPLIGLELIDERDVRAGVVRHRGGGLIVCGEHAGFVRGRPEPLPEGGTLEDYVRAHARDEAALARVFSLDAAYGVAGASRDDFTVTLATLPWREGGPLLSLEGFAPARDGVVLQRVEEAGRLIERRFRVDTLEQAFESAPGTPVERATREWFEREVGAPSATGR
ncbi:MAG TPA: hypothetical protein VMG12_06310 [Polyangiaceae bacterium]|nr:hypothetical protein [Polyangiaceae bacterium]